MKKLPVGIQYFDVIRTNDYVYIDKTEYIYKLLSQGKGLSYFLSRPRRFGKSLLVSTLKELFSGNKDLFKDLWIHESDYAWNKHPVIYLDFSGMSSRTPDELRTDLSWALDQIGKSHNIDISTAPSPETKFSFLLAQLAVESEVVVLIDEYDKPLLNHVNNIATMREIQAILSNFYSALKSAGNSIHFLFVTGVTKFSKTSVFSGMNNLTDLTLLPQAANLLGYTENEINHYFQPHMDVLAQEQHCSIDVIKDEMRRWYNGYQFSKIAEKVFNPFSVLMYLFTKDLRNYWFETGTPSFLVKLIKEKQYKVEDLEHVSMSIRSLDAFEIDDMQLVPLLLQTGYLTIKGYDAQAQQYQLGYPNEEAKISFLSYFIRILTQAPPEHFDNLVIPIRRALKEGDLDTFFDILKMFFASIPYDIQLPKEQYYQSLFYVLLSLLGAYVAVEVRTNNGRIDCTIITDTYIYIFEFKLDGSDTEALEQIERKKYYEKFLRDNKEILLIGVNFDTQMRNIKSWSSKKNLAKSTCDRS